MWSIHWSTFSGWINAISHEILVEPMGCPGYYSTPREWKNQKTCKVPDFLMLPFQWEETDWPESPTLQYNVGCGAKKNKTVQWAFLVAQTVKNPPANAGDLGLIPGSGRCPGQWRGNPLQRSCLENPMDRGAWRAAVHGVTKRHN